MNLTVPPHTQFIQKPVYAALGLLNYLGKYAARMETHTNISYVVSQDRSKNPLYFSAILVSSSDSGLDAVNLVIPPKISGICFVEYLEQHRTDPAYIWNSYGKPAYPNKMIRAEMRRHQVCQFINI